MFTSRNQIATMRLLSFILFLIFSSCQLNTENNAQEESLITEPINDVSDLHADTFSFKGIKLGSKLPSNWVFEKRSYPELLLPTKFEFYELLGRAQITAFGHEVTNIMVETLADTIVCIYINLKEAPTDVIKLLQETYRLDGNPEEFVYLKSKSIIVEGHRYASSDFVRNKKFIDQLVFKNLLLEGTALDKKRKPPTDAAGLPVSDPTPNNYMDNHAPSYMRILAKTSKLDSLEILERKLFLTAKGKINIKDF